MKGCLVKKRGNVPTLIIHGAKDLVHPLAHGHEQAALIPGSRLDIFEGMGHGVPDVLWPKVAALIAEHAGRARVTQ
jgi:pimeloyl-ACP methyl ester carboxylesterase